MVCSSMSSKISLVLGSRWLLVGFVVLAWFAAKIRLEVAVLGGEILKSVTPRGSYSLFGPKYKRNYHI